MTESRVAVGEFAARNGLRKQTVFKILRRLDIQPQKSRGGRESRGQVVSVITEDEARRVLAEFSPAGVDRDEPAKVKGAPNEASLEDIGVFYLLRLEPDLDAGRYKVGFAANIKDRLRQLRCSAPNTKVIKTWPCRRLWEKTAIECVTAGCERLHTEVFRTASLDAVQEKCNRFFEIMPRLGRTPSSTTGSPTSE